MILSDREIRDRLDHGRLYVAPRPHLDAMQPASIDLRLDDTLLIYGERVGLPYLLQPGEFVLGSTVEWVELPDDLAARVEGKSSLGRHGLRVHSTAGFVDPGFEGNITLELDVVGRPFELRYGMKISQITFHQLTSPAERPYGSPGLGSHYQRQSGVTAAR